MAEDLFGAALAERLRRQAPLAARLRPATLDEVVGQEHLLGPAGPLRRLIEADRMSSVVLWGPPGTGKTTLAKLIAASTDRAFETLSAVTAGVKDVRDVVARARTRLGQHGQGTILFLDFTTHRRGVRHVGDPGIKDHGIHHFARCVRHTCSVTGNLRVQAVNHPGGRRSWVVLDASTGSVHARAERFLAPLADGTQRTYAYHLLDHLRWLAATGRAEESVTLDDLRRYMALCGAEHAGPLGVPWRDCPLSDAARAVRAACVKGYYLDLTTREGVNGALRTALAERRLANSRDRDRSMLGHLTASVASNPLASGAPAKRHPRVLPDGTRAAMLAAVRTARDRMIVTWLADSGMRIGELCGLWFCDLHLRRDHPCGERRGPHAHVVKRHNPNQASAKTATPARVVDGVVTGGIVRRASPAMVDSYHEYLAEDYHRVRALAQTDLVLVHLAGPTAGRPLGTHGARQMIERAGRRAGLGLVKPHAFRHTWATALTEATGGNTKAVADEGGWSSSRTVEDTYAHLAGDPALEAALAKVWASGT